MEAAIDDWTADEHLAGARRRAAAGASTSGGTYACPPRRAAGGPSRGRVSNGGGGGDDGGGYGSGGSGARASSGRASAGPGASRRAPSAAAAPPTPTEDDAEEARALLEAAGGDPQARAEALIAAVRDNKTGVVHELLAAGAPATRKAAADGATPLHWAAHNGALHTVSLLVVRRARDAQCVSASRAGGGARGAAHSHTRLRFGICFAPAFCPAASRGFDATFLAPLPLLTPPTRRPAGARRVRDGGQPRGVGPAALGGAARPRGRDAQAAGLGRGRVSHRAADKQDAAALVRAAPPAAPPCGDAARARRAAAAAAACARARRRGARLSYYQRWWRGRRANAVPLPKAHTRAG
jgi:hypothetical protein